MTPAGNMQGFAMESTTMPARQHHCSSKTFNSVIRAFRTELDLWNERS
jgi:hypothetical protein